MMIRILIIWIGTFAVYNTDMHSPDFIKSVLFPVINIFYLLFLFKEFISFLFTLQTYGTKGNEVNVFDLIYDVCSLLYEEILNKYSGKFKFTGFFSEFIEYFIVPVEVICVMMSFYEELQLLAYLAS